MDALYAKLHDKYTKLKANKFEELEQPSRNQEQQFLNYIKAAEELIEHLKSEKDDLTKRVNNYRDEVNSLRCLESERSLEHQNLLLEHNQKLQELKLENERLLKLSTELKGENERLLKLQTMKDIEMEAVSPSEGNQVGPDKTPRRSHNKAKSSHNRHSGSRLNSNVQKDPTTLGKSRMNIDRETMSIDASVDMHLPDCCWSVNTPGEDGNGNESANCVYQAVLETLVGMKLSASKQSQGICISAAHESSGYSFQLTYRADKQEVQLLYTVISLGTLARIAPEWMREDIMFSITMCPLFFQKVSQFILSMK